MGYTPPNEIDIGDAAINRGNSYTTATIVNKGNPANISGEITSVEIWAHENLSNCEVATFFVVSGNNLSTRDTHAIGSVTAGSKQTFNGLNLTVTAGDYIGIYFTAGELESEGVGGSGVLYKAGDYIPCTNVSFSNYAGDIISVYGTGASGAGELTIGDSFSIADSKIMNISKALAEAFNVADSLVKNVTKQLSETFSIADSLARNITKNLAETLLIVDSWVAKISLSETLSTVDSLTGTASLAKTEAFSIVDAVVKEITRNFTEAFSMVDSYRKSINWVEETKDIIDWVLADDTGWFSGWFSKGWFSGCASWTEEAENIIIWNEETKI